MKKLESTSPENASTQAISFWQGGFLEKGFFRYFFHLYTLYKYNKTIEPQLLLPHPTMEKDFKFYTI